MVAVWEIRDQATAARKRLLSGGFLPIPVNGKRPPAARWTEIVATDDVIESWDKLFPDALNTGVLTEITPAVDIDVLDDEAAEEIELALWDLVDCRAPIRIGQWPKRAAFFQTDTPFPKVQTPFFMSPNGQRHHVEVLAAGQQIVVVGLHPETGKPYSWHGGELGDRADLPELTKAMAEAFIAKAADLMRARGWIEDVRNKSNGADHGGDGAGAATFDVFHGNRERKYALKALAGCATELAGMAPNSGRNNRLNEVAFRLGTMSARQWLSRAEIERELFDAMVANKYVAEEGDAATRKTLLSGLSNGELIPHPELDTAAPSIAPIDDEPLDVWSAADAELPPPRGWLLGNAFCRKFVSSIVAEGGTGKSALRMAQVLALASGKQLTGEYIFVRSRVLIVSLEDDEDELNRRLFAACLHHEIDMEDLRDWLFLSAPTGKIMQLDASGRPVVGALARKLTATVKARKIDMITLDPFIKTHSIEENNNSLVDEVVQVLTGMAAQFNVAIDVPHHVAKGAPNEPGNANRGRGAGAMKDAARIVNTLMKMSEDEAKAFGVAEELRHSLIRVDNAKVNIIPHAGSAKWFKIVGLPIGNGNDLYPAGDNVQTVIPWAPPKTFAGIDNIVINKILNDIETGLADGNKYSDAPKAGFREAWRVVQRHCPSKTEQNCRDIIKAWYKSELLIRVDYTNPVTRKPVSGLIVDNLKRPG
jgi:hypothetical protein